MEQNAEDKVSNSNSGKESNNSGSKTGVREISFHIEFENKITMYIYDIFNEFFGDFDSTHSTEKYNPLYRYFALKRLLEYAEKKPNTQLNLNRKRAIFNEMEKASEVLRRGPPKVVECPPWSRNIPSFRDETLDDSSANGVNNTRKVTKKSRR